MSCTARTAARREEVPPVKTKKASLLTKLVVLALLIGAATGLLNLRQQILGLVEPGEYIFRFTD